MYLFSQMFKPITTVRCQVTMKIIPCTIVRVEMRIGINIVGRAVSMLNPTMETWGVGWLGVSTNKGVELPSSVNMGGRADAMLIKTMNSRSELAKTVLHNYLMQPGWKREVK